METKTITLHYKSGNSTTVDTILTAEEIGRKIKNNDVDINPKNLSMVRWIEVESISVDKKYYSDLKKKQ